MRSRPCGSIMLFRSAPQAQSGATFASLMFCHFFFLAISLLVFPSTHYLDDFFQCHSRHLSASGFLAFKTFHATQGFRARSPRREAPPRSQTLVGVDWTLDQSAVTASFGRARVNKILATLGFLSSNRCSADAGLSGKSLAHGSSEQLGASSCKHSTEDNMPHQLMMHP